MKKMMKIFIMIASILCLCINAYSAEYADTLRVGIYYGSAAVSEVTLQSDSGFTIGILEDGRSFSPIEKIDVTSIKAVFDTASGNPAYHVDYSVHETLEEATHAVYTLKEQEIDAFIGYINSEIHVLGGTFKNNNDALWAAENLLTKGTPLSVSSSALRFEDSSGKTIYVVDNSDCGLVVFSGNYEDNDSLISISGSAKGTYRGGFEFKSLESGLITAVNVVSVEDYLYSVVCREMSPSWEVEALKAQAVCARNFALGRINYHSKYGFDVCRTVCCQAYSTNADNSENVHIAVDETKGELLFYEDKLVQAVYSSSMGAYTESVENVWGTPYPYLVSVENPYEDTENVYNGKWIKTLTKARATEIMNSKGYDIGSVTDISVIERTPSNGVLRLQVTGTKGSKVFQRESCRNIFSEVTYSQRYTVTTGSVTTHPKIVVSDGNVTKEVSSNSVSVLGSYGSLSPLSDGCYVFDGKNKVQYKASTTDGDPDTFTFTGEGWGHGVGMSQYGAKGMAEAGFTYEQILTHYYTGTHIEKAY